MLGSLDGAFYDNVEVLSPDGDLVCYYSVKRAKSYLRKSIAEVVTGTEEVPQTIRLLFAPKGTAATRPRFFQERRQDICVVCGTSESLTRHHVVPYLFRKYLPVSYKSRDHHDVVLMCVDHHLAIETHYDRKKQELGFAPPSALKNVPEDDRYKHREFEKAYRLAKALVCYPDKIPEKTLAEYKEFVLRVLSFVPATEEDLAKMQHILKGSRQQYMQVTAQQIIEKYPSIEDFVKMWRKFFLTHAKPKYLSPHWSIHHPIFNFESHDHE